jgi:hypothetical protein
MGCRAAVPDGLCRDKAACYADGNKTTDVIDEADTEWDDGEGVQTVALPA